MATQDGDYEILASAKFALDLTGFDHPLYVRKISGLKTTLLAAGGTRPYAIGYTSGGGASKGPVTQMQATVTGVQNDPITIEFVASAEAGGRQLKDWYDQCHSEPMIGGATTLGGQLKDGSIMLYNQAGEECARWNFYGAMCQSYKFGDMEAGTENLATETITIIFESIHRVPPPPGI